MYTGWSCSSRNEGWTVAREMETCRKEMAGRSERRFRENVGVQRCVENAGQTRRDIVVVMAVKTLKEYQTPAGCRRYCYRAFGRKSDKVINNELYERVHYFITHNKRDRPDRADMRCNFVRIAFVSASKRIVFRRNPVFTRSRQPAVGRKKLLG